MKTAFPAIVYYAAIVLSGALLLWGFVKCLAWVFKRPQIIGRPLLNAQTSLVRVFWLAVGSRLALVLLAAGLLWVMMLAVGQRQLPSLQWLVGQWDASHYIKMAEQGYTSLPADDVLIVFFPLYSWILRGLSPLFLGQTWLAALTVSSVFFGFCAVMLFKLVRLDFSVAVATRAVWALCLAPMGIFFALPYTESLFLLLSLLCLYHARKRNWALCGLCGLLASLTRSQGVLLLVPALLLAVRDWINTWRRRKAFDASAPISTKRPPWPFESFWVLAIPLGIAAYLLLNFAITGDYFSFLAHQKAHWGQTLGFFAATLRMLSTQFFVMDTNLIMGWLAPQLLFFFGALVLIFVLLKRKNVPAFYAVYALAFLLVSYSATALLSGPRYLLGALPLYVAAGLVCPKNRVARYCVFGLCAVIMVVIALAYFQGRFGIM